MKIYITDICAGLCPENVDIGTPDAAAAARIQDAVFSNLGIAPRNEINKPVRKTLRTLLIAAVLACLLTVTAYGVVTYVMSRREIPAGETVTGYWTRVDESGETIENQKITFPYASLLFSFQGTGEHRNQPELRCYWLPSEPTGGITDEDGWTSYLTDEGAGDSIPYLIQVCNVPEYKLQYVISGKAEVVAEENWGDWHMQAITSDYSGINGFVTYKQANFVLLFDAERGYLVKIVGTDDLDTLLHIAREIEVRESDTPYTPFEGMAEDIGILEPGRG